ncbi:hypothetical protein [Fodinibius sp.]|uniref:hypothetical protein n=1 Tax=Fodinibius sp. TaxID=1872440 RepID=UPI002ACE06CE|nr:hypothetical protein [Fodinibius sp.]MDZ7658848.1 hypothetical protein [Fodinibius sp.]
MASLRKRGKYYYIRFVKMIDGVNNEKSKSLGITKKDEAKEACQLLEEMEERGEINPFSDSFDPQKILEEQSYKNEPVPVHTVREAADYFYRLKSHLSDKTIRNDSKNRSSKRGAYERAVEHFISLNDIADLPVKHVGLYHFEKVIFKPNIKSATRHFYYRQLRVFWNTLRDREIVTENYFKTLKKDLPGQKIKHAS